MRESLRQRWERLRSHILFIPAVLVVLGIAAAVVFVELDRRIDAAIVRQVPWIFRAGATGAREVLSTVASAMVQLAAITFSVTIVALALRSQQFGPRLLRNFTRDEVNQAVLGTFLGTFVYALLVLRAVRDRDDAGVDAETFVPLLAVTFAIVLAIVSLALFVIFIDRVVGSIQANSIIAEAAAETREAIDHLFPAPLGEQDGEDEPGEDYPPLTDAREILAPATGHLQTLATEGLMRVATEADVVVRMLVPIGGFVVEGTPLALAAPRERVDDDVARRIRRAYAIASSRSVVDDPEFGVQQIVDVAVKALSPSENDPTTAVTAADHLGALLIHFARRSIPSPLRRDAEGRLRVIAVGPTFRSMADLALNQLCEHGADDVALTLALLETVTRVAGEVRTEPRRRVLVEHLWKISRGADRGIHDPVDRERVNERLRRAMQRLGAEDGGALHYLLPLHRSA